jgi:hypothetical protein
LAYEETVLSDWVRTDFPDLLWPVILVALHGDQGAVGFGRVQSLVIEALGEAALGEAGIEFDGRLTSLDRIPEEQRAAIINLFRTNPVTMGSLPPQVRVLPAMYENLPGSWLLSARPPDNDDLAPEAGFTNLIDAMVDVVSDRHRTALVKAAPFGWALQRGRLRLVGDIGEVLINYPAIPNNRSRADAFILSSFLSGKATTQDQFPDREAHILEWARTFWKQNWRKLPCFPADSLEAERDERDPEVADGAAVDLESIAMEAMGQVGTLFEAFVAHALDPDLALDPSNAAKHEVLCGLVSRASRSVVATLRAPHTWSGEQGSTVMRVLAETRIVITWMETQVDAIYNQYQNYGRGKAKLTRRHMESLIEAMGDDVPSDIRELAQRLKEKAGGDVGDAFQEVSVDSTFSGISLRQMAEEAEMLDVYRHVYQPASGVAHDEWWAIEEYAMQRCMNPLHLVHHIPSFEAEFPVTPEFAHLLVAQLDGIMSQVLMILDPQG